MDLTTRYLGLSLPHPLVPGASPLVDDLDTVRRLEDAGAAALVMHSLFEEHIGGGPPSSVAPAAPHSARRASVEPGAATSWRQPFSARDADAYLEQLRRVREAVAVPVIASLNGVTTGGWVRYGRLLEQAGADALELNLYVTAMDDEEDGAHVESRSIEIVRAVRASTSVPIAVKVSPFYSAFANFVKKLERAGAAGVVLFNRFYEPDIDVHAVTASRTLRLSDPSELLLRLRWVAALAGRVRLSLAVTGGVHSGADAIKAILAGADTVQLVSALLKRGPEHLAVVRAELVAWLERRGLDSLASVRGALSLAECPDPSAFERANYVELFEARQGARRAR
jgi:dihydroorotate dehydrogenase (fumarate)